MLRTRIILIVVCAIVIGGIFFLPKGVVENENQLTSGRTGDDAPVKSPPDPHKTTSKETLSKIKDLKARYLSGPGKEKSAIFADSLANLYKEAGRFDSAAWYAEEASTFFKTPESELKAGDFYYEAFSFSVDPKKQQEFAVKCRSFYEKFLKENPKELDIKTKMAMTYVTSSSPMKGISMLREVLAEDPRNEAALFNMGMLSVQSGQYDRAIERLLQLLEVNPRHLQGQLLLGMAYMNKGDKAKAREQFEKVKKMDNDPSVQATADSYLKDLK